MTVNKVQILAYFICLPALLCAQSKKETLLNQRDNILKEINLTNKLISNTQGKKKNTLQDIRLYESKIKNQTQLINTYHAEITIIENKITDRQLSIEKLKKELEEQKAIYADFIRYSYKNSNRYSKAIFLFASQSINQFYARKKYLDQLNKARIEKIELIQLLEEQIHSEIEQLDTEKLAIGNSLLEIKKQNQKLSVAKRQRSDILNTLSNEEKKLKQDLKKKIDIEKQLAKRIEELIREETKKSSFARLTPEEQIVSDDFAKNQGKLPWPTRQGIITEKFGEHYHPVIKGVKVRNNGIDITTIENSGVRAIFAGKVSKIFSIKGSNYTIIIRHGAYYSVYHNVQNVRVNVGDNVNVKDVIGYVGTSSTDQASIVHLEIWKGTEKLNPELWITN